MNTAHLAAEFVVALFGPHQDGRVYIASLPNPDNKNDDSREHHVLTRSSAQITDFVARHDQPGEGCFTCVNLIKDKATRRAEKTVAQIVCLHAEIDFRQIEEMPEEAECVVADLSSLPSRVHHSGHGLHLYWFLKTAIAATPDNNARHKQLLHQLADLLAGDSAACLVHQLLRLPGTTNSKNGERGMVRVLADRPHLRYELAELEQWIAATDIPLLHRKAATKSNGASPDNPFLAFAAAHASEAPLDVDQLLANMIYRGPGGGGNAHDTLLRCTAALLSRGEERDAVVARILAALDAAAALCGLTIEAAREQHIIEQMCDSWLEKHPEISEREPTDTRTKAAPHGWWHGDVDVELRRKYLVKKLLPETGTGLLSGQWGTYKTFAALDLTAAVMTGGDFAGHLVKRQGGVLFIAVEGREDIPIRLEALNQTKCGKAERLPFFCLDDIPHLLKRGAAEQIAAEANAIAAEMRQRFNLPLSLIIIDTVAASAGYAKAGDENDAALGQRTLAHISRLTGAFVLAVDHFGKAVETGTRGTSAKESFADVVLALLGNKEMSGAVKNPRMAARKRRAGSNGEEFTFNAQIVVMGTDEDGDAVDTLVIEWGGATEPEVSKSSWPKSLRLLHRTMMALLAERGTEIEVDKRKVRALDHEILREEFFSSYAADGDTEAKRQETRRGAFRRAIGAAQNLGLIGVKVVNGVTFVWFESADA
jgi:hypothetical protein